MPAYVYRCDDHGDTSVELPVEDRNDPQECDCGAEMRRVFTAPAVKFKGPGFYTTDAANLDKQKSQGRELVERGEVRPNADLTSLE